MTIVKVLFVSSWYPYPPDNGSKIRINSLLCALAQRHDVTLLAFADVHEGLNVEAPQTYCRVAGVVPKLSFEPRRVRAVIGFFNPLPRSLVDTYSHSMAHLVHQELADQRYDLVIASEFEAANYVPRGLGVPTILEDLETTVFREACSSSPNAILRFRAWLTWVKMRQYVRGLLHEFDACTVVSELERRYLAKIAPEGHGVTVVPNGVDVSNLRSNGIDPMPNTLVFNGALTFSANYDAVRFFLSEIWQRVKAAEPLTRLKITGRSDGVGLSSLCLGEGAELTGYLPDIRPTVAGAWACVVPLRIGGGTRLKILEAMALGTPVVSTSKGVEGLEVTPEVDILIADDPAEFAEQTVRLLRDPALRERLAENGRRLVEEKYDWRRIGQRFNQLVESVAHNGKQA